MENEVKHVELIGAEVAKIETKLNEKLTANTNDIATVQKSVDDLASDVKRISLGTTAAAETKSGFIVALEKADLKSRKRNQTLDIELDTKAAADMLRTSATVLRSESPTLLPYLSVPTDLNDVVAQGTIGGDQFKYVRETGFEGAPAFTAEGALKPQVSIKLATKTANVVKIAAHFKVSEETTKDYPAFMSYLQARVADELNQKRQAGQLYGDGLDENLQGISTVATAFSTTKKIANANEIDVLRLAIAQVRKAKIKANAILMNPADVASMELTKDTAGNYILPTVLSGVMPNVGRVQIIELDIIEEGTFLVGSFDKGAQYLTREGLSIRVYDQNEDDAKHNMVLVVVEERGVQAVYRPEAFVKGTFATAIASLKAA